MKIPICPHLFAVAAGAFCLLAASVTHADYASAILADHPAGYWRLGEMPVNAPDIPVANSGSLGAAANGDFNGYVGREEPGALAGSDNKAMRFWGNIAELSRVYFGSASSFDFAGNGEGKPFTLEVWAKPLIALSGTQRLISNGSSGQGYGLAFFGNNTVRLTAFGVVDSTSAAAAAPFASNQWYHIVAVRGVSNVTFYVNGVQLGSPVIMTNVRTTTNPLTLGRTAAGGEPFTGVLDEPAVYTNMLTAEQVFAHYSAGLTNGAGYAEVVLADNPIGYWRLNEPKKTESTSVIANTSSLGTAADGAVYGAPNSVNGGLASPLAGDANTAVGFTAVGGNGLLTGGLIDVPNNAALNTASFSVECWARMDSWVNAHQSPVTSRFSENGTNGGFILYAAPATVSGQYTNLPRWEFWTGVGDTWNTVNGGGRDVATNKWTHVVGTYDAATRVMALYVDGRLARGLIDKPLLRNPSKPLRIGAGSTELRFGQYHWRGGVDEVAVYPAALSPQQVLAHFEAGLGFVPTATDAPGVLVQPTAQTNWAPSPIVVSCVITGSLPMALQWYHVSPDNTVTTPVADGTNMVLRLDPSAPAQSGSYYLAATNALGGLETSWAYVEIFPTAAPVFVIDAPSTVPVYAGGTAGIPAIATNTPPISYQWQSNSVDIADATNTILTLPNVQPAYAAATFQAKASNPISTVTSSPAQLSVLAPPVSTYAAQATSLNPLAYWRLGEPTGNLAFDYWGGHPAVYVGAFQGSSPGALLDDDDGAVSLSGAGSYVRTLETAPFSFYAFDNFTLSAFIKVSTAVANNTPARIFSNWQGATTTNLSSGFGFGLYGMTKLRFTAFGVVDFDANVSALTTDQWYHLAAVRSNNWVYLYINGALANNGAVGGIRRSAFPLQLGGNPAGTEAFAGSIDEAAVFGRALSASEIAGLYSSRFGSLVPPSIVTQPTPARVYAGGTARFEVQAIGSATLGYVWKANNVAIPDATNTSLVLTGLALANNGVNYTVTVTNRAGTATSQNALLTVTQPTGYPASVVADGPVSLYRLGETAGPLVYDAWGGYNGQDSGSVVYGTAGALGEDPDTAATFDGSSAKIEIPFTAEQNPPVYSVEAWAKVTGGQGTYRAVVSSRDEGTGFQKGYIIYGTAGNFWSFWTSSGSGWQTLDGPAIVLDQWTHLAAVYDGITKYFYVNGNLVGTQVIGSVPNNLRPLRIGTGRNEFSPGEYWFVGAIDEVAVYSKALSAERIAYHAALGIYGLNTPPFMVREPLSQSPVVGSPVTLNPVVGGSPTLFYQWLKDGAPLPGATTARLPFASVAFADGGDYVLTATNAVGSTNSAVARITVMPQPSFALLTNELVLHLSFDADYQDSSGRANHATPVNAATLVAGKVGSGALHYSTAVSGGAVTEANYVTLPPSSDLFFGTDVNFSVAFWTKFTGLPGDLPFLCNNDYSYGGAGITLAPSYNQGGWSWYLSDASAGASQGIGLYGPQNSINDGNWHHLVFTFDRAGFATVYRDGLLGSQTSITNGSWWNLDTGRQLHIGQAAGLYAEAGAFEMDDLGIWRKVLTPYEALSIYNAGQGAGQSFDVYGPVQMYISAAGGNLTIAWQAGTLEWNEDLANSSGWAPVPGAAAPNFTVTAGTGKRFYRVRL